jgi:hypothetical protein
MCLAGLALALWALGLEGAVVAATVAGAIGAVGAVRPLVAWRRLSRLRREADVQLSIYRYPPDASLAAWRRNELYGPRRRKLLARSLERVARNASENLLPGAAPLNRVAVRRSAALFPIVAERLRTGDELSPRGILLVEQLLRDPDSPLYAREHEHELGAALTRCLAALARDGGSGEVQPPGQPAPRSLPESRAFMLEPAAGSLREVGSLLYEIELTFDHTSEVRLCDRPLPDGDRVEIAGQLWRVVGTATSPSPGVKERYVCVPLPDPVQPAPLAAG